MIAVDRRGHGQSDKPEQEYTIAMFSDDIAFMCQELGLDKAVFVVHSQDGLAFDVAARYPELTHATVLIDGPTFIPEEMVGALQDFGKALPTPRYKEAIRSILEDIVFLPSDSRRVLDQVHADFIAVRQDIIRSTFVAFTTFDTAAALKQVTTPLLYIQSHFPSNMAKLQELCSHGSWNQQLSDTLRNSGRPRLDDAYENYGLRALMGTVVGTVGATVWGRLGLELLMKRSRR